MEDMSTKQKGDIAEQAAISPALKRGWGVLRPVGDRLPYDLVFDLDGCLVKIQVKTAWADQGSGNYMMDTRRTKTNRRVMCAGVTGLPISILPWSTWRRLMSSTSSRLISF